MLNLSEPSVLIWTILTTIIIIITIILSFKFFKKGKFEEALALICINGVIIIMVTTTIAINQVLILESDYSNRIEKLIMENQDKVMLI